MFSSCRKTPAVQCRVNAGKHTPARGDGSHYRFRSRPPELGDITPVFALKEKIFLIIISPILVII